MDWGVGHAGVGVESGAKAVGSAAVGCSWLPSRTRTSSAAAAACARMVLLYPGSRKGATEERRLDRGGRRLRWKVV